MKYRPFPVQAIGGDGPHILLDATGKPYAVYIRRVWPGEAPKGYATEKDMMDCHVEVIKLEPEGEDAVDSQELQVEAQSQPDIIASGTRSESGKRDSSRRWFGAGRNSNSE